jgi:poly(hydroxyalkanoate) depolymerase family esterase
MPKKLFFIVLAFFSSIKIVDAHDLYEISNFGTNPGNLKMYIYKPAHLADSAKVPAVVVLHGCLQNAEAVANVSEWNKLADIHGFYVVYPQQKYTNNVTGCFNWFRKNDIQKGKGEVHSVKEMIDYMNANFNTDAEKIYVTGLSAGAAMSVAIMACYPESINAGAIFAGGPYKVAQNALRAMWVMWLPPNRSPKKWAKRVTKQNPRYAGKYPRLIVVHGRNDFVVSIRNAWELIQQWSFLHRTDPKYDNIENNFSGANDVSRLSYTDSDKKEVIVFYKIKNMGHALPIDKPLITTANGKKAMFTADKKFNSTYWIAKDFGLIKK